MNATGSLTIHVNDRPREVGEGRRLADLMTELGLADRKGVAAAVNGAVVPRGGWPATTLAAGDRVLVIQATQGG
jgi:sulfur carrier protein